MSFSQSLCAINEGHNDLHVFAIGSANTLNFIHGNSAANQWTAICPGWNGSAPLQSICAVTDRKDALYVFGIGIDNTLYLTLRNVQSTWSEWSSNWNSAPEMSNLKSTPKLKSISVVTDSVINVLRVFGVDITNTLYFSQTSTQGNWIGWTRLGSCPKLTSVVAVHDSKNVLHVFGIGSDNTTYMTINNGYSWTPNWNDAPKLRSVFALNIDKFLHVFGVGTDNTFYTTYRNLQGIWSEWYANWNLAPKLKAVLAVNDCNNALHVFGIGIDNTLYLTWRNLQGTWSEWYPNWNRAPKLTSVFAVNDSKNALHVFGIDQTNNLCLTWRSPDGNWSAWTKEAMMPWPFTREQHPYWMKMLPDSKAISDINIPGSHDAAAINSVIHTPYSCQHETISEQLRGGIRLLDIRLCIDKKDGQFIFMTCHGDKGPNRYQSFESVLSECATFLSANPSELLIMILKVDDWETQNKEQALAYLKTLLGRYPTISQRSLPMLGQVRGKILLYNRIDKTLDFGAPIFWKDNTTGVNADSEANRAYNVYVQDKYEDLSFLNPDREKLDLVTTAFNQKKLNDGNVVLNFASATAGWVFGVNINDDLIGYLGKSAASSRPTYLGWILFDYGLDAYRTTSYSFLNIVDLIVASNYDYKGYEKPFELDTLKNLQWMPPMR